MGGMATSGGYYIAAACDKIVANPGTLTGSIGVIMQLTNVEELMKKVGVKGLNIKSGANKDLGSPFQAISPEGREILQSLVDNVHSQFVAAVAKGRGMNEGQVRKLADGRVYSGAQAKDLGLMDQFGTLEDAIELAAKRAGLEGEPAVYYSRPEQERWWERMFHGGIRPSTAGHRSRLAPIRVVTGAASIARAVIFNQIHLKLSSSVVREMI